MKKFKALAFNNKKILNNLINLSAIQLFNIIAPLIIYPLTLHRLGLDTMGLALYYQGIIAFLAIFINYGFYISGPKLISNANKDKAKINKIVSSILIIKIIIWLFCLLLVIFISNISYFNLNQKYIFLAFLSTFYELFFMQWFFQGVERLKPMVLINTISKVLQTIAIYFLVKNPSDLDMYLLIIALNNLIAGISSLYLSSHIFKLKFLFPKMPIIKDIFFDSGLLFLANITNSLKDRLSIILIGNYVGMSSVASYDLAIRIINISIMPINLIVDAFFPSITQNKNKNKIKKLCKFSIYLSTIFVIIEYIAIEKIVEILSGNSNEISILLATISLSIIPILSLSTILGKLGLIAIGNNIAFLKIVMKTSILYLVLLFLGYSFNLLSNVFFYMIVTILIYLVEFILRLSHFKKRVS
ncbi:oligosaccharide flippase family protein [Providencia rettgeri]|nr:oligosaccharide flippase family protein [Providencia rettgeri]